MSGVEMQPLWRVMQQDPHNERFGNVSAAWGEVSRWLEANHRDIKIETPVDYQELLRMVRGLDLPAQYESDKSLICDKLEKYLSVHA